MPLVWVGGGGGLYTSPLSHTHPGHTPTSPPVTHTCLCAFWDTHPPPLRLRVVIRRFIYQKLSLILAFAVNPFHQADVLERITNIATSNSVNASFKPRRKLSTHYLGIHTQLMRKCFFPENPIDFAKKSLEKSCTTAKLFKSILEAINPFWYP